MAVWQTQATMFKEVNGESSREAATVTFTSDLSLSWETSPEYQKLAWQAVRNARPEWQVPESHVTGVVKTGTLLNGTLVMLSHEYTQVS